MNVSILGQTQAIKRGQSARIKRVEATVVQETAATDRQRRERCEPIQCLQIRHHRYGVPCPGQLLWSYVETRLRRQERSWGAGRQESRAEFIIRLKGTAQRIPASLLQKAIGNLASRVPLFIYQQFASM